MSLVVQGDPAITLQAMFFSIATGKRLENRTVIMTTRAYDAGYAVPLTPTLRSISKGIASTGRTQARPSSPLLSPYGREPYGREKRSPWCGDCPEAAPSRSGRDKSGSLRVCTGRGTRHHANRGRQIDLLPDFRLALSRNHPGMKKTGGRTWPAGHPRYIQPHIPRIIQNKLTNQRLVHGPRPLKSQNGFPLLPHFSSKKPRSRWSWVRMVVI